MNMITVQTVRSLSEHLHQTRLAGKLIGLVPTMGALHEGHASLIRTAAQECEMVVVSIFVNPTQFRPSEDFTRYPRTLEADQKLCQSNGAHLVFAPTVEEMYGTSSFAAGEMATSAFIEVPGLSDKLEGKTRPGHFRGVATVVAKLFLQTQPDRAYFGQKDAQQLAVIRQMVRDLHFPIQIIGCPTLRESDGLAMSSRNRYLTPQQRPHCTALYHALCEVKDRVAGGERDVVVLQSIMQSMLDETPGCIRDYAYIVDPVSFQPVERVNTEALAVIAAHFGSTRLIDNMVIHSRTEL